MDCCNNNNNNNPIITNGKPKHNKIELRYPAPGEWGWIMSMHGKIYSTEYGWNQNIELIPGQYICDFMAKAATAKEDSRRSRAWIAAVDGAPMGSVLCTEESETIAKLRLLIVAPEGRGLGLGTRLINQAIQFAKDAGYKKLILWTHGVLVDARRLYDKAGFRLASTAKHSTFGPEVDGHMLELDL